MTGYEVVQEEPRVLRVYGATLGELFEMAGYAVFDQGHDLASTPATYSRPIIAAGDDPASLLAAWIDELLGMSRIEGIVPSYFVVDRLEDGGVQGSAAGLPRHDVVRIGPAVVRLAAPPGEPVEIPDGWWVDLTVELEPRLQVL